MNEILGVVPIPVPGPTLPGVDAILVFPKGHNGRDKRRCIVYSAPPQIHVSAYFSLDGKLLGVPGKLMELYQSPVILYSYRNAREMSFVTYSSMVESSRKICEFALEIFNTVVMAGTGAGAAIATCGLHQDLLRNPGHLSRVHLFNHDSFSSSSQVALPWLGRFADLLSKFWIRPPLNAQRAMAELIQARVLITLLAHENDTNLPKGTRMVDFVATLPFSSPRLLTIISADSKPGTFDDTMVQKMKKAYAPPAPAVAPEPQKSYEQSPEAAEPDLPAKPT